MIIAKCDKCNYSAVNPAAMPLKHFWYTGEDGTAMLYHLCPECTQTLKEHTDKTVSEFVGFDVVMCKPSQDDGGLVSQMIDRQWISVDDKLPPEHDFVLVTYVINGQCVHIPVTAFHKGAGEFETVNWYVNNETDTVTHWMPLPNAKAKCQRGGKTMKEYER